MSKTRRVGLNLLALGLIAGAFAGLASALSDQSERDDRGSRRLLTEELLLDEVNRHLPAGIRLAFVDVPAGFGGTPGVWLEAALPPESEQKADTSIEAVRQARDRWEASLALGMYRDKAALSGMRIVDGVTYRAGNLVTDSARLSFEAGAPERTTGQVLPLATDTAAIERAIGDGAILGGMTVERVAYAEPAIAPAPIVELRASDPEAALRTQSWLAEVTGRGKTVLEGWFIVIRDASGEPFYVSAVAHRAGGGSSWVRPDLVDAYRHGGGRSPLIIPSEK
jgi:hypothetical protein